jgi:hypothetical protein
MDEGMINQALGVLQSQFGSQLRGDMHKGEVTMRRALMEQLQMDESTADKVVKQLAHTGWISFRSGVAPTPDDGTLHTGGPSVVPSGDAPGVAGAWNDARVTTGNPATDATVRAEPIIAAGAISGMQTGNITAGGEGGAYVGAAAAGLAAADARGVEPDGERPDPARVENRISSIDADHMTADEPGYWRIAAPGEGPQPPRV